MATGRKGALVGTLLLPKFGEPPYDTVLIPPGSGPIDRDGNRPGIVAAATYQRLAEELVALSIGSVRIDNRGLATSPRMRADENDGLQASSERSLRRMHQHR